MTRIMKTCGVVAVVAMVAAGCGSSGVDMRSAATVGDKTIPLADFQHQISQFIDSKPVAQDALRKGQFAEASRQLLSLRIQHELIAKVAQADGLRPDPAQVDTVMNQPGVDEQIRDSYILDRQSLRENLLDQTMLQDLARKKGAGLELTVDSTVIADPLAAKNLAKAISDQPDKARELMQAATGQTAFDQRLNPAQDLTEATGTPIFGLHAGEVAAFPAGGQNAQWYVVRVTARSEGDDAASAKKIAALNPKALSTIGQRMLTGEAEDTSVTVNPRYGAWDSLATEVSPAADQNYGVRYSSQRKAS